MLSPAQSALDRAMTTLQNLFPKQVQLVASPGVNLAANVGAFRRERAQASTGYQWIEFGKVVLRRQALTAAGITTPPDSGQKILVDGKTYRIQFVTPDTTSYTLDCMILY